MKSISWLSKSSKSQVKVLKPNSGMEEVKFGKVDGNSTHNLPNNIPPAMIYDENTSTVLKSSIVQPSSVRPHTAGAIPSMVRPAATVGPISQSPPP